jgi:hypothetical protein
MIIPFFLCFPIYIIAQMVAIFRLPGGWRWASLVPVIPMIYVVADTIKAFEQPSNLWPLPLLFSSPLALVYILLVIGLYQPALGESAK